MTRVLRRVLLAVVLVGASASAWAQSAYVAFEQISVTNSAVAFTAAKITPSGSAPATIANCTLDTADIRYTIDGTTPTSGLGLLWTNGASLTFYGHDVLERFRGIRTGGSNGSLNCSYASGAATPAIVAMLSPGASVTNNISVASNGATGSAVPASADYVGINIGGTLTGVTGFSLGTARAPAMAIVDGSGNQITSFGGGSQFGMGTAQASNALGTIALGYDGTNVRGLSTNASGQLNVIFPSAQAVTQSGNWNARLNDGAGNSITSTSSAIDVNIKSGGATGVAQGSTTSGQLGTLTMGAVTTAAPSYTTAQTSPLSLDTAGNLRITGAISGNVTATLNAETTKVIGTVNIAAAQTIAVTNATASNFNAQVVGAAASGASKAGNPVQVGGVFNTTQPTVTSGQAVELQATSRGAVIIATGTEVPQFNLAQVAGNSVLNGNGTSGTGSPRMTIASDNSPVSGLGAGATASAVPANAVFEGINVAGTLRGQTGVNPSGVVYAAQIDIASITGVTPSATSYLPIRVTDGTNFIAAGADYTHDGALTIGTTAGPMTIGRASATAPTNVSAADDAVAAWFLLNGSQVVNLAGGGTLITATGSSLNMNCTGGCASTSIGDNSTYTAGSTTGVPVMGALDDAATSAATEDRVAITRITAQRGLHVNLRNTAGTEMGTASNPLQVSLANTGSNGTAVTVSGTITANYGSGNYANNLTQIAGNAVVTGGTNGTLAIGGAVAHDGVGTGINPLLVGGYASQAAPADVSADGDATRLWTLRNGSLVANLAAGGTLITATSSSLNVNVTNATLAALGTKTNNAAAPGATNLGVLPAIANAAAQSWTEGNLVALSTDLSGQLRVTGSLTTGGFTDNGAFTAGTSTGSVAMGFYHAAIDTVTDGRAAALAINNKRGLMVQQTDSTGADATDTTNHAIKVNVVAGSTGNAAASATGSAVPGSADYQGLNVSGTLRGRTGVNPSGSVFAAQTDLTSVAGTTTSVNSGSSDAGTLRVTDAYDGAVTLQASQVSGTTNATTSRTTSTGLGKFTDGAIVINITNAGAATGTLNLYLQDSCDGGTTWDDLVSANSFTFGAATTTQQFTVAGKLATSRTQGAAAQQEALAAGTARQGPFCDRIRVREKVSGVGGTPTGVTYTISGVFKR